MWHKWTKTEHDLLIDRLVLAEEKIRKLQDIIDKEQKQQLTLTGVVGRSEQLEPYEPDNFPKCGLCKSIHDPEMCCQY